MPAGTYTPVDLFTHAKALTHKIPSGTIQADVYSQALFRAWTRFPWNWTQASITPITLTDGNQDFAHSQTDFYRFVYLRIVRTDQTPNVVIDLNPKSHHGVELRSLIAPESVRTFSWEGAISKIRLQQGVRIGSGSTYQLQGEYQKKPVRTTEDTINTAMDWPDHYFEVLLLGVRHKLYELAGDARAGIMKIDEEGRRTYTGMLGSFMGALSEMAEAEDLSNGEDTNYPESPLGAGTNVGSGSGMFF
jgi:hypothetical protein